MKKLFPLAMALLIGVAPWQGALSAGGDSGGAGGGNGGGSGTATAYERAAALVEAARYRKAIRTLEKLKRKEPGNADVLNLLGFAHRKLGEIEPAFDYYREALAADPGHLGANEYLGELYLETDRLPEAEERLARLDEACPSGCEERRELAEAIDAYKAARGL